MEYIHINKIYQILFVYIGIFLPKFQDINQSIKKIFYEILEEKMTETELK
ncbi:hypothetical protein [Blattabacterium cuenoti]|nr:hypothetical protein [Blattabacterium cuenoti]